jgi:hypothetical protein
MKASTALSVLSALNGVSAVVISNSTTNSTTNSTQAVFNVVPLNTSLLAEGYGK